MKLKREAYWEETTHKLLCVAQQLYQLFRSSQETVLGITFMKMPVRNLIDGRVWI